MANNLRNESILHAESSTDETCPKTFSHSDRTLIEREDESSTEEIHYPLIEAAGSVGISVSDFIDLHPDVGRGTLNEVL